MDDLRKSQRRQLLIGGVLIVVIGYLVWAIAFAPTPEERLATEEEAAAERAAERLEERLARDTAQEVSVGDLATCFLTAHRARYEAERLDLPTDGIECDYMGQYVKLTGNVERNTGRSLEFSAGYGSLTCSYDEDYRDSLRGKQSVTVTGKPHAGSYVYRLDSAGNPLPDLGAFGVAMSLRSCQPK